MSSPKHLPLYTLFVFVFLLCEYPLGGAGASYRGILKHCKMQSTACVNLATYDSKEDTEKEYAQTDPLVLRVCEECGTIWQIPGVAFCCRCDPDFFQYCHDAVSKRK